MRGLCMWRQVAGSGSPILLVHGFGASVGHWKRNIPAMTAAGYQVRRIWTVVHRS
jgi:pimeloyl-ACP methyl ester carboxylesterase